MCLGLDPSGGHQTILFPLHHMQDIHKGHIQQDRIDHLTTPIENNHYPQGNWKKPHQMPMHLDIHNHWLWGSMMELQLDPGKGSLKGLMLDQLMAPNWENCLDWHWDLNLAKHLGKMKGFQWVGH